MKKADYLTEVMMMLKTLLCSWKFIIQTAESYNYTARRKQDDLSNTSIRNYPNGLGNEGNKLIKTNK